MFGLVKVWSFWGFRMMEFKRNLEISQFNFFINREDS